MICRHREGIRLEEWIDEEVAETDRDKRESRRSSSLVAVAEKDMRIEMT